MLKRAERSWPAIWLAGLFLAIGWMTSRVALICHELVGHAGVARALGSSIDECYFFLFAGGYVSFHREIPYSTRDSLAIYLGGIATQIVCAGVVWGVVGFRRKRDGVSVLGQCFAILSLLHAGAYLAAGCADGYGDGRLLFDLLGQWRWSVVLPLTGIVWWGTFRSAASLCTVFQPSRAGVTARTRVHRFCVALALAGSALGGLAWGEVQLASPPVYLETMRSERARAVDRQVERLIADYQAQQGRAPDAATESEFRRRARRQHARFPWALVILAGMIVALYAGAWAGATRASPGAELLLGSRFRSRLWLACCIAGALWCAARYGGS